MPNAASSTDPAASPTKATLTGRRRAVRTTARPENNCFLPRLDDIPIPPDLNVGATWSEGLRELACWIGAYDALRFCDALAGQQIYIARALDHPLFATILSPDKIAIMARVYGGSKMYVPTAAKEIRRARRAGVIAAVRAGHLSGGAAAQICRTSRTHMATLVNASDEGVGIAPIILPEPKGLTILKQAAGAVVQQLGAAGVDPTIVANAWAAIMALWSPSQALPILPPAPAMVSADV